MSGNICKINDTFLIAMKTRKFVKENTRWDCFAGIWRWLFFQQSKVLDWPEDVTLLLRAWFIDAKQPLCALLVLAPGDLFQQNNLECPGSLIIITHLEMRFCFRLAQRKEAPPSYSSRVSGVERRATEVIKGNECRETSVRRKNIRNMVTNAWLLETGISGLGL